ncbi:MAG TPA: hypothetical protein VJM48_15700 [Methylibium sp.]|nr:hypothetical protein [Methylibium sp.]
MWRALDLLGWLKWPTLLAILVAPPWFYFGGWRDGWNGYDQALYGPELVAGMPLLLSHDAGDNPLGERAIPWNAHLCADCAARLRALRLGYADCDAPPLRWTEAHGANGRLQATPPAPAASGSVCLWVELEPLDALPRAHRWPLRGTPLSPIPSPSTPNQPRSS